MSVDGFHEQEELSVLVESVRKLLGTTLLDTGIDLVY